jgi:hypothetical protein
MRTTQGLVQVDASLSAASDDDFIDPCLPSEKFFRFLASQFTCQVMSFSLRCRKTMLLMTSGLAGVPDMDGILD